MAIVIGKPGKFFSAEQAVEHIGGYLVFNDITARDIQRREMEFGVFSFSKAIDTFCPIDPYILTSDEVDDPHDLDMELRVNDPFANYLKSGDVVEAEIEKLGVLRNPVISWQAAYGSDAPPADSWI
jgi:2-keto-4-pentenoate hydratase/2-oxohepta-3-ene-1,7-dioic acid hydratase in catechol pathway